MRLIRRGGYYISGIRIDKPSPYRVIVPAAEVVQARLGVVDIPAIAQGIHSTQRGRHGTADGHGRTPGVIGVGHHLGAAGVHKTGDIALGIFQVEIPVAVVRHGRRANGVVGKMQLVAAPGHLRQLGYLFLLVGFLILQVGRYFPAPQAFKLHAFLACQRWKNQNLRPAKGGTLYIDPSTGCSF